MCLLGAAIIRDTGDVTADLCLRQCRVAFVSGWFLSRLEIINVRWQFADESFE